MTQIHGNAPPRDRLDDSTGLQKRLLQDLERQWLDTWGQARQLQAQAGFQMAASNAEADAGAAVGASDSAPRQTSGQVITGGEPREGPVRAESSASPRMAEGGARPSQDTDARTHAATNVASSRSTAMGSQPVYSSVAQAHAVDGPQSSGMERVGPNHDAIPGAAGAHAEASSNAQRLRLQPDANGGVDAEASLINAVAGAALASGGGWGAVNSTPPEQASAATTLTSTTSEPTHLALLAKNPAALPSSAAEGDAELSAPTGRRFSASSPDAEPASQHLMLRELNEQEVLASMRDAQLGSLESQVAAQELARALMQAGYARVQVVVNGHQRRHGDASPEEEMASDSSSSTAPDPQPASNIQFISHGH